MTRRYRRYRDGPDPLAPPFDVAGVLDDIGDRVLDGADPQHALRDLLRNGPQGGRGLDDLLRQVRKRRRELAETGRLGGTLDEVRRLLDTAIGTERAALFGDADDDARLREAQLDALPSQTAQAVSELREYQWRSPEAAQTFAQIDDLLRQEVLDAQFAGLREALQNPDPAAQQQIKEMLADLNALLAAHGRGEDTGEQFADFMQQHGQFFPDNPQSVEDLIESLARRAAAAERMMNALSPEQRAELNELMQQAIGDDLDLQRELDQLAAGLRANRPDLFGGASAELNGQRPLGMGEATDVLSELSDLDALAEALAQNYPGASIDDVDEEAVRRALGRQAVDDLQALRRAEKELEKSGYLTRSEGRLDLSPKALRRIGQTALRRVFASLSTGPRGDHDVHEAGAAGEMTGATRQWQFGDEQPIDVVGTVRNALRRTGRQRPVRLQPDDFTVLETERRSRAAVVLLVDQSFSMVMNDTWRDAKVTALALHALAASQFPQDAICVIGFANMARQIRPEELASLDVPGFQGTNLQHALMLAGRFLDRHPDAEPVVLVITDGEPTAHLQRDGDWHFSYPPSPETISVTLAEVDRMTRRGATLSIFRLGDDPRLERFVEHVARRNGGRVLAPASDRLGDYVVADFLRSRRRIAGVRRAG